MLVGLLERSGVAGCAMSIVLLTAAVAVAQVGGDEAPVAPLEGDVTLWAVIVSHLRPDRVVTTRLSR